MNIMKLIVSGSTGFVGKEVVNQALKSSTISSVVALSRRPLELDEGINTSKLATVVLNDFGHYPDEAKKQLADADACIWTMAITPTKSNGMDPNVVKRITHDHTFTGLDAIMESRGSRTTPLRFMYISGIAVVRDLSKIPAWVPEAMRPMVIMRGEVENELIAYAKQHPKQIEVCVARPGLITSPEKPRPQGGPGAGLPSVDNGELVACLLSQVMNGFEKDPLMNDDLVRIGQEALH